MAATDSGARRAVPAGPSSRRGVFDAVFGAIGSFAVRFRWLVVAVWVAGALAALVLLPSLSSVTQASNAKFLPASAPAEQAAVLAAPFGTANLQPVPVVAARSGAPLTRADAGALAGLQGRLRAVPGWPGCRTWAGRRTGRPSSWWCWPGKAAPRTLMPP